MSNLHGDGSIRGGKKEVGEVNKSGIFEYSSDNKDGDDICNAEAGNMCPQDNGFYGHMTVNKIKPSAGKAKSKKVMF